MFVDRLACPPAGAGADYARARLRFGVERVFGVDVLVVQIHTQPIIQAGANIPANGHNIPVRGPSRKCAVDGALLRGLWCPAEW